MPTLVFSAIVLLLQDALDLIKEIGNQLLGCHKLVGPTLIGFVAVPMVEGGLAFDKLAATMPNAMGIVVSHQPAAIAGMEGQRIRNAVGFFSRSFDRLGLESGDITVIVDDLFTIKIQQICEGLISMWHAYVHIS
ncbi:hypothetical protein amb3295 [Paramagnetospirillum magneticum AMB-1]|uniref:Uncharacterized protein n=1 Tax=Paramagnetospirillum magneticum (strain ATCC 700264 / AMB-1) TaxID=342108 RepID=Q2W226_PARM1|nr:hypothetical protein amb3295 [Paramagnetospirillum magneticum AMB-1]